MRFEIEPTAYAVRVYDGSHPDNYVASAQIRTYGDRGWMSSITGRAFYDAMAAHVPEMLKQANCSTLEGYVTKAHARLMRMAGRGKFAFKIAHEGDCAGREMVWVVISALEEPCPAAQ